jgi:tetratricopeptide (TPR) repeat protein
MRQIQRLSLLFLFLSVLVLPSCSGRFSGSADEHIKRGDQFLADKKLREALVEYRSAVQADGRSGPARQKLGQAYLQNNEPAKAFKEFVTAADLMPDDIAAQLQAGQVLLLVGQFADARGRAEKVLAKEPQNIDAHIMKGNALAGLKDFKAAIEEVREAIQTDPTKGASYAHLGALQFAQGDVAQAEVAFKRAVATDPKSTQARLALANLYWSTGRRREAEEALQEAVKLDPTNPLPNQALAMLYLGTNRMAEAEGPLKVVAERSGTFDSRLRLADYYASVRRLPEAKVIYEQLAAGGDGAATAKLRMAALGLMEGDRAGAYRIIDEILTKDPKNVEAFVARAQLQFADGKMTEALASARSAVAAGPSAPLAQLVLGRILSSQHQLEEAEEAFKDALRASPGFAPANVELARLAILAGKNADAIRYSQAAISRVPGYGEAYLLLARAQVANGDAAGAEAPLKLMSANFPDSPVVQAEAGRLLLARGDAAGAAAAFTKALAKNPLEPSALEGMVVVELRQKRQAAARSRLDAAVAAAPKNAEVQMMAAQLYVTAFNDPAAGEAAIKRAIATDSSNLAAYGLLAKLYVFTKNLPAATAEFEKLSQRQPKSVANLTAVGLLYQMQSKADQAKAGYERALAIDPRAPIPANNLAQLYSDRNENLDVALQLAQTAKAGLPTAHEVDDTLGWIYYKKGNGPMAVTSLKQAVAGQPDNPVYLYHLGAAYALNKDKTNARQLLEKGLKLQPNFPGADDARRILDSLKN